MNTNQLEVEVNGNKIMITLTDDQIKQLQTPKKMEWYEEIEFDKNVFMIDSKTRGGVYAHCFTDISSKPEHNKCIFNNLKQSIVAADYINLFIEMYNFCQLRNGNNKIDWSNGNKCKYGISHSMSHRDIIYVSSWFKANEFIFGLAVLTQEHAEEMLSIFGDRIKEVYSKLQNY